MFLITLFPMEVNITLNGSKVKEFQDVICDKCTCIA